MTTGTRRENLPFLTDPNRVSGSEGKKGGGTGEGDRVGCNYVWEESTREQVKVSYDHDLVDRVRSVRRPDHRRD